MCVFIEKKKVNLTNQHTFDDILNITDTLRENIFPKHFSRNDSFCKVCEKQLSKLFKQTHEKTNYHNRLSLLVVNRFNLKNIKAADVDYVLQNRFIKYNKKFLSSECYCEFKSDMISYKTKLRKLCNYNVYLIEKLLTKYNCLSSDTLVMKIVFITNLQIQSDKQYL